MTNTKHTPGPWVAIEDDGFSNLMIEGDGRFVAEVMGKNKANMVANAHRIVHCVNTYDVLLEALEEITESFYIHPNDRLLLAIREKARAVIAKAKGEA